MSQMNSLALAIQARLPVLAWGEPGIGKSAIMYAIGDALHLRTEVVIASVRDPTDFGGLPVLSPQGVNLEPPAWAKRLKEAGDGLLFIDEISTAPPATQAALLRAIQEGVVGDLELPETIAKVAAANPPDQAAGGWELTPPLANRFMHLEWKPDFRNWCDGMIAGFGPPRFSRLPDNWQAEIPAARALVVSFLDKRSHLAQQLPKNDAERGKAWPSYRSWTGAASAIAACNAACKGDDDTLLTMISGFVGHGVAIEWMNWRRELDLPDPEWILADPARFKLPKRGDQQFAVLSSVIATACRDLTKERWLAAWDVVEIAARGGAADVAAASVRPMLKQPHGDLPTPSKQLEPIIPLLKAAGML